MPRLAHCPRCGARLMPGFAGRLICPLFSACGTLPARERRRGARRPIPLPARRAILARGLAAA